MDSIMYHPKNLSKLAGTGIITLAMVLASSCRSVSNESALLQETPEIPSDLQPAEVFNQWNAHIQEETSGANIQKEGCWPTHVPAQGPSKGVVVLVHGFTACPQQFFNVAPMIARQGFDVFLPLMPGQGRVPKEGLKEDYDLPKGEEQVERYKKFVERINKLAAAAQGTKVIGGLSGGGAIAAGAAVEGKNIWNRAVFMAPFFKFPMIPNAITTVAEELKPDLTSSFGKDCTEGRTDLEGRRGICEVTVLSMRTMLRYGILYRERLAEVPFQIQFVGAEKDPTVDNKTIFNAFKSHHEARQMSRICFYKKGVPHSMMSRKENKSTGHWWMNSLEKDLTRYITLGIWFPNDPKDKSSEKGADRCIVDD